MGFVSRVRQAILERENSERYFSIPASDRPITFYAEDAYTWNQFAGYVEHLTRDGGSTVAYVTSALDDPLRSDPPDGLEVFFVDDLLPKFLPRVDSAVLATTMPDLDVFHVKRPAHATCLYLFHSLNSTHMAYRERAFDAYDVFGVAGPYQEHELAARFSQIGKTSFRLEPVGYYKLDRIAEGFRGYERQHPDETTVLVAPSWGEENLLATCGAEVVGSLAAEGFRTVVRPHPAFFESVYPAGRRIVEELQRRFADHQNVVFETAITSENSFYEAALMVSDWSGSSFEYAFGTERPVLFVDVPRKVFNASWESIGSVPFEDRMRHEVGTIVSPGDAANAGQVAARLIAGAPDYSDGIREARRREIYNFGSSAAAGATLARSLVE